MCNVCQATCDSRFLDTVCLLPQFFHIIQFADFLLRAKLFLDGDQEIVVLKYCEDTLACPSFI